MNKQARYRIGDGLFAVARRDSNPTAPPVSSLYISTSHTAVFIRSFSPSRPLGLEHRTYFAFMHAKRSPTQRIRPVEFAPWSPEWFRRPLAQKMNEVHRYIPCTNAKYVRRALRQRPANFDVGIHDSEHRSGEAIRHEKGHA